MKALSIKNLTKTYANGTQALKGIDFSVDAGDFYALLGPNGAGKTTAIGIISSLVNKTGGDVEIFAHSIDTDLKAAKTCIGLVPQEINLNLWEKVENVVLNQAGYYGLGRHLAHERAEKYLRALRLWDRRGDNARSLSGGMKRRLMIARAMVNEPRLLILDDATSAVDPSVEARILERLRDSELPSTVVIVAYCTSSIALADEVIFIDEGKIVAHGTHTDLSRDVPGYARIVEAYADDARQRSES